MTRWEAVRAWRDRLWAADLGQVQTDLSAEGLRAAVDAALDSLDDASLQAVAARRARPWPHAVLVTTATVSTAALEWLAVLLGHGSTVTWKPPADAPGLAPLVRDLAGDLPLHLDTDRGVVARGDVVIVLGSDDTIAAVRAAAAPRAVVHGHGHAWSAAWITGQPLPADPRIPEGFEDPWGRLAADAALHDGRGCLSPVLAVTPLPLDEAADALADAFARAQARWPRGRVHADEAAATRSRRALARASGVLREGEGWSIHGLLAEHAAPRALPRSLCLVHAPDAQAAAILLGRWGAALSTVGTDDPDAAVPFLDHGATRITPLGRMQRPPLDRVHDGVRWVDQAARAVGVEVGG